jgi:signal peptidase II
VRFLFPAALVDALDPLTKQFFWRNGQNYELIPGFFNVTLLKNAGAAFGMFQGGRVFFVIASIAAIVLIIWVGWRLPRAERFRRICLSVILGGAIGNLIDRVIYGEVIDFVQIGWEGHYWPVFNVADMAVSLGAVFLVIHALRSSQEKPEAGESGDAPLGAEEHAPGR